MAQGREKPQCGVEIDIHTHTLHLAGGRVAMGRPQQCSRKGRTLLVHRDEPLHGVCMCATHARMAADGFIDSDARVMHRASRQDYQRGRATHPYDEGLWKVVSSGE